MESLSQRELRNRSADVLRAAEAGESFVVTNDGRPVARLVPLGGHVADLPLSRPARRRGGFAALRRARIDGTTSATLDDLRGDR